MSDSTGTAGDSPVVRVSAGLAAAGAVAVVEAARDAADSAPVVRTGPTGIEGYEPLLLVTDGGRTALYPDPDRSTVRAAVSAVERGALATDEATAVVDHAADRQRLPTPASGPLSVGTRGVLGPCGWVDPLAPADHEFVSADDDAGAAVGVGLLGRGRGDAAENERAAAAWGTARDADGDPVVVVNANDADERVRGDRTLLAGAPLTVLDGLAAVASYVGAGDAVVYLSEADTRLHRHLREAVDAASDRLPVEPQLVAGPAAYRAGEPTAALEAMEGADRVEPRRQPPTPAEYGLYGRPTVVHTPRTVAQVRRAMRSPGAVDATAADPGTRVLTVSGDGNVRAPATVELPSNGSLAAVREAVTTDGPVKMACVGGVFGGITRDLAVPPTAPSLSAANLGTDGAVELLGEGTCPVATAGERARFAADENSGRCVPGREGTKQLTELLRDVYAGSFETDTIRELARTMRRSSNCKTGARAPRPVVTAIDAFEPEFRAHADDRCPSGTCSL